MSDLTPEERARRTALADAIHAASTPLLPHACDLVDIERRAVQVGKHTLLAIDLWFTPVMQDGPVHYLCLLCEPEAANTVHLLSQEQYDYLTNNTNPAPEADTKEADHG